MIVARHFSAWNSSEKIRPVGNGVILTSARFVAPIVARLSDPIIPSLGHQALKCLATIIQSLRDEARQRS